MSHSSRVIVGALLSFWGTVLAIGAFRGEAAPFLGMALFLGLLLFSIFIHELGHTFGAWIVRWNVVIFSVGWLALHCKNRQLLLSKRVKLADAGGWVLAVPSDRKFATPLRELTYTSAGPAANLLQMAISLILGMAAPPDISSPGFSLNMALFAFGIQGFFLAIVALMPHRGRIRSDGTRIVDLIHQWRNN